MDHPDGPFHAHVYYTAATRGTAMRVRDALRALTDPQANPLLIFVGELRDHPVGPHPLPQFEIHFPRSALARLLPALETCGLRVLVHPLTDDDLADHTVLGRWIGEPLPLDLSTLDPPGSNQGIPRYGKSDF